MKPRLIEAYMDIAERFAQVSECQRLKVGAIIVKNGSILAHGWNGTPSGFRTNVCGVCVCMYRRWKSITNLFRMPQLFATYIIIYFILTKHK